MPQSVQRPEISEAIQLGGEKIYYVLLLVTINFLPPGATAQNKVGAPRPLDSDPLT